MTHGKVVDAKTLEPLPGARVWIVDEVTEGRNVCYADIEGKWNIETQGKFLITVHYIAYVSTTMLETQTDTEIIVPMVATHDAGAS